MAGVSAPTHPRYTPSSGLPEGTVALNSRPLRNRAGHREGSVSGENSTLNIQKPQKSVERKNSAVLCWTALHLFYGCMFLHEKMQGFLKACPSGALQGKEAGWWGWSRTDRCLRCMTLDPPHRAHLGKKGSNSLPRWPGALPGATVHVRSAPSCCATLGLSETCGGPAGVSEKLCPGLGPRHPESALLCALERGATGSAFRLHPRAAAGAGGRRRGAPASGFREGGAPPPCFVARCLLGDEVSPVPFGGAAFAWEMQVLLAGSWLPALASPCCGLALERRAQEGCLLLSLMV